MHTSKINLTQISSLLEKLIIMSVFLFIALDVLSPISSPEILLSSFHDDFYYYLKIAENLTAGLGSTYNNIVQTNGYHPLWLLVLSALVFLSGILNIEVLTFVKSSSLIFIYLAFIPFAYYMKVITSNKLVYMIALLFSYKWYVAYFAPYGMETILTIPLFIIFIISYIKNINPFLLGFIASLVILSRLDSIVILGVFFICEILVDGFSIKRYVRLAVGAFPVPAYLLINMIIFDSLLPVSGLAKNVLEIGALHSKTYESLIRLSINNVFVWIYCVVYLYSLVAYCYKPIKSNHIRTLVLTSLIATPVFFIQTSLRSDWPLWGWYLYPLILSFLLLVPLIDEQYTKATFHLNSIIKIPNQNIVYNSVLIVLLIGIGIKAFIKPVYITPVDDVVVVAENIKSFEQSNPGIYAMGDGAGAVGHLIKSPIIQLEGLVMDKKYLTLLESSDEVEPLLNSYNVDYYIGSNLTRSDKNCFVVIEPLKSRGFSRQIRSKLCWPLALEFQVGSVSTFILKRPNLQ
jgi:hypothetical protein